MQSENKKLKAEIVSTQTSKSQCYRCGRDDCPRANKCPANGKQCQKCQKLNHFAKVCRASTKKKKMSFGQVSSAEESDSEESSGRIVVGHLEDSRSIAAKITIQGPLRKDPQEISLATDTGISKTLLNSCDWNRIKECCRFVRTSKRFRPYGTAYHLPIKGKAKVTLQAENGVEIETWIYVVNDKNEQSLFGKADVIRLGIVQLNLQGAETEVIKKISFIPKESVSADNIIVSGGETQQAIDKRMQDIIEDFQSVFTDIIGRFRGEPIKIQVKSNAVLVIQAPRRIPLHCSERAKTELEKIISEDIIEGPIDTEEPGTFLSNLVITAKKGTDKIRVTLDCQELNKSMYPTHEPIPTVEELRHEVRGSDRFSSLDFTNCYYQFEIEENVRKLYAFRTPWGTYRYKRMVMGTSPESSEIQKKIRETVQNCRNIVHIKDDIIVHGVGQQHDQCLTEVLRTLQDKGITLRPDKCHLGQPQVKWFGYIFSKDGMSPDPEKCSIIKNWPAPKSSSEVKSFLQTVQFNSKFLGGKPGELSYSELTEPLRALTRKNARFVWGTRESAVFEELQARPCSSQVLVSYDTHRKTRLYVDSSFVGTQATVAQQHTYQGEEVWRPVNHTSRSWTATEAGYGQVERESSNGILTGMHMNKMYVLRTHTEAVTDHKPLLPLYSSQSKSKQPRVDRH